MTTINELVADLLSEESNDPKRRELEKGLRRVFGTPAFAAAAAAYGQRNAGFTQPFAMERMIGGCEALLAGASRPQ